jgi:hypothetical protein
LAWPVFAWDRDGSEIDASAWANWGTFVVVLALAWSIDRGFAWLLPFGEQAAWRAVRDVVVGQAAGPAAVAVGDVPAIESSAAEPMPRRTAGGLLALIGFLVAGALWLLPPVGSGRDAVSWFPKGEGEAEHKAALPDGRG